MIISHLSESDRARAFSILRWATFALRHLTILEITEALLISDNSSHDDIMADEFPDDMDEEYINSEILELCGSLVEVRKATPQQNVGSRTVHLTHFSVRQYIISSALAPRILSTNERLQSSNEAFPNNVLAKICLRYLNFNNVWEAPIESDNKLANRSFRDYAAGSWHRHVSGKGVNYEEVLARINEFFHSSNTNWESWRRWFDSTNPPSQLRESKDITSASPLYYASSLGLGETVAYLTEKLCAEPNHVDSSHRTALNAAAANGRLEVIKILLGKGADLAIADTNGWTPLNAAAGYGHLEVVKTFESSSGSRTRNISGQILGAFHLYLFCQMLPLGGVSFFLLHLPLPMCICETEIEFSYVILIAARTARIRWRKLQIGQAGDP